MDGLLAAKDYLETLSYLTILIGFPLAIYQFWRAARKEELDREYGTYNALDEKYIDYQRLCFQNSDLDVFDIPDASKKPLSEDQQKRELIAFTMLFSIFERAYLMYYDEDTEIKQKQWVGWHEYIGSYCKRDNFRSAWATSGTTFDSDFQKYMTKMIESPDCAPDISTPA